MNTKIYTYLYASEYDPSMPVIDVGLSVPGQTTEIVWITALVDSGADGTLLPIALLENIGARYIDKARVRGLLGHTRIVEIYLVNLHIGDFQLYGVRAAAVEKEIEPVLGRNVLNQLAVTLNGPASTTEVLRL